MCFDHVEEKHLNEQRINHILKLNTDHDMSPS